MSKSIFAKMAEESLKCLDNKVTQVWIDELTCKIVFSNTKKKDDFISNVVSRQRKAAWWNFYNIFQKPLSIEEQGDILRVKRGKKILDECKIVTDIKIVD